MLFSGHGNLQVWTCTQLIGLLCCREGVLHSNLLRFKIPLHSAPQSFFSKQCSSSCCNLSALWYLEAAAHLTDKVLLFLAFALLFDPVLSSGRQQWFPQPVGSSGCLVESLHLPVGNSFTITRISGSCIWPPRPGSRSSKWCVLKSVTITS